MSFHVRGNFPQKGTNEEEKKKEPGKADGEASFIKKGFLSKGKSLKIFKEYKKICLFDFWVFLFLVSAEEQIQ